MRSFELKLAWADKQTEVLKGQIAAWHAAGGYGAVFEKHPERPGHIIRLKVGEVVPSIPLALGDSLYALRSGLDHLAYDLAVSYTDPLPERAGETSEFPIFGDRAMNASERTRKIGAMHPDAAAVIDGLQPHLRPDYRDDPLWRLNEIARIDRHRFIHVTVAQLAGIGVGGINLRTDEMEIYGVGPTTEDGTELGYASVRPIDPGRPMEMHVSPEPEVILKEGDLAGVPVLDLVASIREYIDAHVVPPLLPFLR